MKAILGGVYGTGFSLVPEGVFSMHIVLIAKVFKDVHFASY